MNTSRTDDPIIPALADLISVTPSYWGGRECVTALKTAGFQWRQMEWIGFYFEHLCFTSLNQYFGRQKRVFFNTKFDGASAFPWDLKAHCLTDINGRAQSRVILNDKNAIDSCVGEYGALGLAILTGSADFDLDGSFVDWHEKLKGKKSAYQLSNPDRKSRARKAGFHVRSLDIYILDGHSVNALEPYSQGKNSNGRPRPLKYMLDTASTAPNFSFLPG